MTSEPNDNTPNSDKVTLTKEELHIMLVGFGVAIKLLDTGESVGDRAKKFYKDYMDLKKATS